MTTRIRIRIVCNECGHSWRVSPDADPQCAECNSVDFDVVEPRKLTRQEQLEGLADRGIDTWEEYRGER